MQVQKFASPLSGSEPPGHVAGIFDVKIDNPKSKDLSGTAKTTDSAKEDRLDVAFHAALK